MDRTRKKQFEILRQYIRENDLQKSRMLIRHMGSDVSDFPNGGDLLERLTDGNKFEMINLLLENNLFTSYVISYVLLYCGVEKEDWVLNKIKRYRNSLTIIDLNDYLLHSLQAGTHKVSEYLIEQGATIKGIDTDSVINSTILEVAGKNDLVSLQLIDSLGIELKDDPDLENDIIVYTRSIIIGGYYDVLYYLYGYPIFEETIQANKDYWINMLRGLMKKTTDISFTELYELYVMIYNLIVYGPLQQ